MMTIAKQSITLSSVKVYHNSGNLSTNVNKTQDIEEALRREFLGPASFRTSSRNPPRFLGMNYCIYIRLWLLFPMTFGRCVNPSVSYRKIIHHPFTKMEQMCIKPIHLIYGSSFEFISSDRLSHHRKPRPKVCRKMAWTSCCQSVGRCHHCFSTFNKNTHPPFLLCHKLKLRLYI